MNSEEKFRVTDMDSAEWVLQKKAENAKKREEINAQYDKMVNRYTEWRDKELEELNASDVYFDLLLSDWLKEEVKDSKKKSLRLPSGRIGFRAGQPTFKMNGEPVSGNLDLMGWAQANAPENVKTKTTLTVDWAALKKRLQVVDDGRVILADTGEIVEGMTAEVAEPSFYVKVV